MRQPDPFKDKCIRFDWAIKRLLRQKANFGVLEGFLTVFLGEPIKIIEILESEGNRQTADDKFNRVDIKARDSKGEIILIEVQNTREAYYLERILYGVAKAIVEHIATGDSYSEVKKVYSISILYFSLGQGDDYLYHGQNHFVGVHTHDQLRITRKERNAIVPRTPEDIFPEYILIRVNEFNKVAVTPLEEWVAYLKDGTIRPDTTAPGLGEARRKMLYYDMSPQEQRAYNRHLDDISIEKDVIDTARLEGLQEGKAEGLQEGMEKGLQEGLEKGKAEGLQEGMEKGKAEGWKEALLEMARKMKEAGQPVEAIASLTGLDAREIEGL